jgi:integration host factor subunit alpha
MTGGTKSTEQAGRAPQTLTKADLVEAVHRKVGFSKKDASEVVERVFETMKQTLERGEDLKLSGFGKFDVRRKNARRGRNPKTEEGLIIPARTVVTFKASQVLKARVGGDGARSVSTIESPDDGTGPQGRATIAGSDEIDDDLDDDLDDDGSDDGSDDDGSDV